MDFDQTGIECLQPPKEFYDGDQIHLFANDYAQADALAGELVFWNRKKNAL